MRGHVTATGQVTLFTFPDGKVLQDLTTINLTVVWSAGDNEVRARDVGIDQVRVQPDGTVIQHRGPGALSVHRRAEDRLTLATPSWSHTTSSTSRTCARSWPPDPTLLDVDVQPAGTGQHRRRGRTVLRLLDSRAPRASSRRIALAWCRNA